MKPVYFAIVLLFFQVGCISSEPKTNATIVADLCKTKINIITYPAGVEPISSVTFYEWRGNYYYGAGGLSGGLSGYVDIYDTDTQLTLKKHWDDISNNIDPCFDLQQNEVECPKLIKKITCIT